MARIFITGSNDGLGFLAARELVSEGHEVVLHARNKVKGYEALKQLPGAAGVLTADLSDISETKELASGINVLGVFDAIIHNAGVYNKAPRDIIAVNVLAPYLLTAMVTRPKRLVYLCSNMHLGGFAEPNMLRDAPSSISYSDSKLLLLLLCKAVARRWPGVFSNAVHPGWVPTKMGGINAPDELHKGYETQTWLAVSNDTAAKVSGHYYFHKQRASSNPLADNIRLQDSLLDVCSQLTGVSFPRTLG